MGDHYDDERFDCAPVLLIGFNRPDRLAAQVERLRHVRPRQLFVAVDGPRNEKPGETEAVARTRKAVELVDWPCEVQTRFLDTNHGCRHAPPEAISWMLENVEAGIILEDDCVPTQDFLRYASELLERYRNDDRVGMISGDNFYGFQSDKTLSYHFSRHVHIWGWATWRRAWNLYDGSMSRYQETVDAILNNPHPTKFERYWRKHLKAVLENPTTWDIQWCVAMAANQLLCAVPRENLISNVGHEPGALHTGGYVYDHPFYERTGRLPRPLTHPPSVSCDERADVLHASRQAGLLPRVMTALIAKIPLFRYVGAELLARGLEWIAPVLFRI